MQHDLGCNIQLPIMKVFILSLHVFPLVAPMFLLGEGVSGEGGQGVRGSGVERVRGRVGQGVRGSGVKRVRGRWIAA